MPYQPPLLQTPQRRAPKLPLQPSDDEIGARRVLALLWPLCESSLSPTTTVRAWRHRNKRPAAEIAALGLPDDTIRAAHARAKARLGGRCYSVRIVADELSREISRAREAQRAPTPTAPTVTTAFLESLR